MDSFRAKAIQQSFIPFNSMIHQGQPDNGNPPQLPNDFYRYQNAQLHNISQKGTEAIMPQIDRELFEYAQLNIKHPLSALGLLQIKTTNSCYWEIGALVSNNLIVTPYCIQEVTHATFYPAFNLDKYFYSVNISKFELHHEKGFSIAQLDFSEDISKIVGIFGLKMTEKDIFQDNDSDQRRRNYDGQRRRNNNDQRRRPPREQRGNRRYRREEQREIANQQGNIIRVVTYAPIQGVASLINIDRSMNQFHRWVGYRTIQGICLYVHNGGFMSFIGVVKNNKFTFIKHDDVVQSTDQVNKKLICPDMQLSDQEILWIASKKWNNLVTLNLQNNNIDSYACKHFSTLDCTQLKELNLNKNPIKPEGYFELKNVKFPQLLKLELKNTLLGNEGCRWLSLTQLPNLIELNLRTNSILSSGCSWLVNANWPKLKCLNLTKNKFSNKGCEQISRAKWNLETVLLKDCQIQDSGCKWLTRTKWPFLRELDLEKNLISSSGYKWLGKGSWKYLSKLLLGQNIQMSSVDITRLATLYSTSLVQLTISLELSQLIVNTLLRADFPHFTKLTLHYQISRRGQRPVLKDQWIKVKFPNCKISHADRY